VSASQPPFGHADLGPELRALAQAILDRIDPTVRAAAAMAAARAQSDPGPCQQVWCPVCALGALVTGEEHPLLTVIAEHSVALLTAVRAVVDGTDPAGGPPDPDGSDPGDGAGEPEANGRYQHIPITVQD